VRPFSLSDLRTCANQKSTVLIESQSVISKIEELIHRILRLFEERAHFTFSAENLVDDILFEYVVERYIKHKTCCCRHRDQNETGTIYRYQFKNIVGRIETASVLPFLPSLIACKSTAFRRHFYKMFISLPKMITIACIHCI